MASNVLRRSRGLHLPARSRVGRASSTLTRDDKPLQSILVANRGEIALRVRRTAQANGIKTTTLYTDADVRSQHALSTPFSHYVGDPTAYLDGDKIIQIALARDCDAVHPGWGFLSENSAFAKKCTDAGLVFIGPPADAIEAMGNKSRSKEIMNAAGVPCIPGYHGEGQDPALLEAEAGKIGYPVLLKAVKGGGGKGMRICRSQSEFQDQLASAKSEARSSFGDDAMLVEKYITVPRHIEVQVFADRHGNCVALGERDCSIQRRHQKVLEESPAPNLAEPVRQELWERARAAALAVGYEGAGTVEFIFDNETGDFFFMEMNTRLQVEHPVSEMVTGLDLVQWQIAVAQGEALPMTQAQVQAEIAKRGHAIEARIYAENPDMNFIPDSGKLIHLSLPPLDEDVRVDAGFVEGDEITSHYDPMIAKLIVRGRDRPAALQKLAAALDAYEIAGPVTNIPFLQRVVRSADFAAGDVETGYIEKHRAELFAPQAVSDEVWVQAALGTLLQEVEARRPSDVLVGSGTALGFGEARWQARTFHFSRAAVPGSVEAAAPETVDVHVRQQSPDTYAVRVGGEAGAEQVVTAELTSPTTVRTFFPHTRVSTTVVRPADGGGVLTLFQQGRQYRLAHVVPRWAEQALGLKDVANSVVAPMPCKVLRVDVAEGDVVAKGASLVVIESMKMETVIRSPQEGRVRRVVHRKGDICKAGTSLVEFE